MTSNPQLHVAKTLFDRGHLIGSLVREPLSTAHGIEKLSRRGESQLALAVIAARMHIRKIPWPTGNRIVNRGVIFIEDKNVFRQRKVPG